LLIESGFWELLGDMENCEKEEKLRAVQRGSIMRVASREVEQHGQNAILDQGKYQDFENASQPDHL
jgi:hypothetical protein